MILLVTYQDESEDEFDIAPGTRVSTLHRDGYWLIRETSGRDLAIRDWEVVRVEKVVAPEAVPERASRSSSDALG